MSPEDAWEFYTKGFYGPGAPPEITTQPASVESYVNPDSTWTMSVTAGGTTPLIYQWYKDGQSVEGATNRTITGSFTEADAGSYYVTIINDYGNCNEQSRPSYAEDSRIRKSYEGVLAAMNPFALLALGRKYWFSLLRSTSMAEWRIHC
jgi:hypothetical protein